MGGCLSQPAGNAERPVERLRPGQEEAIAALVAGQDCLVVMPSSSGKSAIYQIAAGEEDLGRNNSQRGQREAVLVHQQALADGSRSLFFRNRFRRMLWV